MGRMCTCYVEMVAAFEGGDAEHRLTLFRQLSITGQAIINAGAWLTTGNVHALRDGNLFEPVNDGGVEVILVPVIEDGMSVAAGAVVADVVAFQPDRPERWRLRTGDGVFLGMAAVESAKFRETPLVIFPTPLAWLQGECDGAVILDWGSRLFFHIGGVERVICADARTAQRLADAEQRAARPCIDIRIKETACVAA